ncbi:MAG: Uma2 family endonuclease [Chloroflexi bacterium]|nr:Uma2 family endonuclease [Chloroflexota bacterium]
MAVKEAPPERSRLRLFPSFLRTGPPPPTGPPLLEPGDRLTRLEFERRYNAMPALKKAELIEGVVHMPSPARHHSHGKPHGAIIGWLVSYAAATPGVDWSDNATVRLDVDNELQPDVLLRIEPAAGGQSRVSEDDYIEGAPELIVEIAASSVSYDLYDKLNVYRRNGVQEYLVWQVNDKRVDWLELVEGQYLPLEPDESGVIRSRVFPGLWLAVPPLLEGDMAAVLAELQQGLAPDSGNRGLALGEHVAFVQKLASSGTE